MKRALAIAFVALAVSVPASVGAGPLGTQMPANCVAHTSFDGSPDLVDDFRCAGIAIEFHTAGVALSPAPIWAGQWLFKDEAGQFRVGSCTFNRGIHPTIDAPSFPVAQQFPNDPTGAKGAYLTWRYGDTTDDLTAAAMWAVFHFYAQDSAGTRRATNAFAPLIPSLQGVATASGRADIQALAIALDAQAASFAGEWAISVTLSIDGSIDATVVAGTQPVAGATVMLLVSGQDAPMTLQTGSAGTARSTMSVVPGVMTVVASTAAPGPAAVYRGSPAGPDPQGAQRLVTGGVPRVIAATATVDVSVAPTTTTTTIAPTTTTTIAPTTIAPTTMTTIAPITTIAETTTTGTAIPDTTTTSTTVPVSVAAVTTVPPAEEVLPPIPGSPLPRTG
ncbi:MAG TPA: hypothetical protein VGC84_01635, partial [Ilumatobacteraceae bacterium]